MVYPVKSLLFKTFSQKDIFWNIHTQQKEIFLTFDDGPVPGVTTFVLEQLRHFNAKATFFCVGDNVRKNPHLYEAILQEGHSTGNHTFHHISGWGYSLKSYLNNVEMCNTLINSKLFRPPYGKITPLQRKILQRKYYVILWSVLPGDFDNKITSERCLQRAVENADFPGCIVVMHDSLKSEKKLRYVLPRFLEYYTKLGYTFSPITEQLCQAEMERKTFLYPEVVV